MKHKENGLALSVSHLLDRFPFLSLRDIFPRPGEVVLWDGAFGSTEKFPAKVQSLRHARGPLFEGAGKTVRF